MKIQFAPSLMCMDISNMKEELTILGNFCDLLHVDIMDGHFVKNIALSPDFMKAVRLYTKLPMDAHLMVTNPEDYVQKLAEAGAHWITIHIETVVTSAFRTIRRIKALGCKAGVAICPATPVVHLQSLLDEVDMVTVMTVDPGYAGEKFIPQMAEKVRELDALRQKNGLEFTIQCDGAIGKETYKPLYEAGACAFVMGSSGLYFKNDPSDLEAKCRRMHREFAEAVGVKA